MRLEIPVFTRCCGCLPLRRGIIVLTYMSLAFTVFFIWVELQFEHGWSEHTVAIYRGATYWAEQWLPVLLYCIDIVFILVLLFGAHTERPMLMRVYYYYGIATTAAALAIYFWTLMRADQRLYIISYFNYYYLFVDLCTIFIGIVTQVYLLLLIRSQLQKPPASLRFVNHLTTDNPESATETPASLRFVNHITTADPESATETPASLRFVNHITTADPESATETPASLRFVNHLTTADTESATEKKPQRHCASSTT